MIVNWIVACTKGDLNYRTMVKSIKNLNYALVNSHYSFLGFTRYIAAKRLFRKVIAGGLEGSRSAAAAYPFEFAGIAFAL